MVSQTRLDVTLYVCLRYLSSQFLKRQHYCATLLEERYNLSSTEVTYARVELLTAVQLRTQVFWSVTLYCWITVHRRLEGKFCLVVPRSSRVEGLKINDAASHLGTAGPSPSTLWRHKISHICYKRYQQSTPQVLDLS